MSMMRKMLGVGAGAAAIAAANSRGSAILFLPEQPLQLCTVVRVRAALRLRSTLRYARSYGYANTSVASQQCTAAVQSRLYNRSSIGGILGVLLGANTTGRVLGVTRVDPRSNGTVRVRGIASSGRYAYNNYGPYGVGAYGAMGYNYANSADLSFRCDVAPNGAVYSVSINRR